jgi:glycosyltransferase involved in cell wall biosynthesis
MNSAGKQKPFTLSRITKGIWWRCIEKWLRKISELRRKRRELYKEYPVIRGLGASVPTRGKVLFTCLLDSFDPSSPPRKMHEHAYYWRCKTIVDVFASYGFSVDVTDRRNMRPPRADEYDCIVGNGLAFQQSCKRRRRFVHSVYLGFGEPSRSTVATIRERSRQLRLRRNIEIEQFFPVDDGPLLATEVWYLGNDYTRASYRQITSVPLRALCNTVVDGIALTYNEKVFSEARNNFMWMAVYGTLLRGLDVVLEVFETHPDWHLWICGHVDHEKSFFEHYKRQLFELPNVHYLNWVDVNGDCYRQTTLRCGYILHPSASDAMPGAVVNAMAAGVIPIFTEQSGMECGENGLMITSISHQAIEDVVSRASAVDPSVMASQARKTSEFARAKYSKDNFIKLFRSALEAMLSSV